MKSKPKRPRYPSDNLKRATITLDAQTQDRFRMLCEKWDCQPSLALRRSLERTFVQEKICRWPE